MKKCYANERDEGTIKAR
ncbi:Protein of unknown function [Bacillus mycoides]|nr:Protein of unknown function [Bacillus mycoides]